MSCEAKEEEEKTFHFLCAIYVGINNKFYFFGKMFTTRKKKFNFFNEHVLFYLKEIFHGNCKSSDYLIYFFGWIILEKISFSFKKMAPKINFFILILAPSSNHFGFYIKRTEITVTSTCDLWKFLNFFWHLVRKIVEKFI